MWRLQPSIVRRFELGLEVAFRGGSSGTAHAAELGIFDENIATLASRPGRDLPRIDNVVRARVKVRARARQ